jgi:hypothetical protein
MPTTGSDSWSLPLLIVLGMCGVLVALGFILRSSERSRS